MAKKLKNRKTGIGSRDTIKKRRLVSLISDNLGNIGAGKKAMTLTEILLKAGYSESSARQQSTILIGVQSKLDPIVNKLIAKRDLALDAMTDRKFKKTGLSTLAYIVDIFTKNTELLSGRATERNYVLSNEEMDHLDKLKKRK